MKRLISIILCLILIMGCFAGCKKKAVPTVVSGEQITRGAWVKLLADSFYLNSTTEKPYFSDIAKDNELFNAVQACVDLGIIEKEDKFNKDNAVTYKEIALNTVNAIGISTVQDYLKTDKKLSEKKLLNFATDKGIVKSTSEKFATTTDAETAVKTAVTLYLNKPFVEKEKIELNDNIIDLKDQKITAANDSFTYDKADTLKAGDIIILPPTEEYVGGVARKVESISGNTVNTVTPKLEEVYETIQLSSVTVPKVSDIKAVNDGVTFENYSEIELTSAQSKPQVTTLALNSKNNSDVLLLGNKGASFNVNINITKGKLSIDEGWNSLNGSFSEKDTDKKSEEDMPKFRYDKNGKIYTSKYKDGYEIKGKISISDLSFTNDVDFGLIKGLKKADTKVNFKASVNLSVKGKINETIDVFTAFLPIGTTGLLVEAVFSLTFDANGDVSVKCTLENTTTYTYEKGLKTANDTKLNNKAAIAGNLSAKVGPRVILDALGIDLFDIRAMIGLASKAEVSAEQGTSEIPCADVKVYAPTLSIGFAEDKNTILNQLGFSATWKVYDVDGGWQKPLTTLTYHYEAKNGWVDKCTHPEKTVTESATTSSQQQSSSQHSSSSVDQQKYHNEPKLGKYIAQMYWNTDNKLYAYITLKEKGVFTIESNYDIKNWKECEPFTKAGTYILENGKYDRPAGDVTWLILYLDNKEYATYAVGDGGMHFQDQEIVFNYTNSENQANKQTTNLTLTEAKQTAENLISKYHQCSFLGVCCDVEYSDLDMSRFLTQTQKNNYYYYQYKITCCHSIENIKQHILKHFDKSLVHELNSDNFFYDDKDNIYVFLTPFGIAGYGNISISDFSADKIVAKAEHEDIDGPTGTYDVFVIEKKGSNFIITNIKR